MVFISAQMAVQFFVLRFLCMMISYWVIKTPHSKWHFSAHYFFSNFKYRKMKCPWLSIIWKFPAQTEHEWVKNQISLHFANEIFELISWMWMWMWMWKCWNHRFPFQRTDRLVGDFPMQLNFIYSFDVLLRPTPSEKGFVIHKWNWFSNGNCSSVNQSVLFYFIFSILINQKCASLSTLWVWIRVRAESRFHSTKWASSSYTEHIGEL